MTSEQIPADVFSHYQSLQRYVGWTDADARCVQEVSEVVRPSFAALVDDFYVAIQQEPLTAALITGGEQQIARLKETLLRWLDELFSGNYDHSYVTRRWQVGRRHVEIGLRQVYANAALARLRAGLQEALERHWNGSIGQLLSASRSLNRLLDLELALIDDAYTSESLVQQGQTVRRQSEATFRNLVEAARCAIVIVRADHTVAYFSPFAEQLSGYSSAEVLGQDYFHMFLAEDQGEEVSGQFQRILAGGPASVGSESQILCHDGQRRWILWNIQRLDHYASEATVLFVGHDITDLKRAQDQVLQSERLSAIGQMVAGLAHESRNAFQRSQASLEMLAVELEGRTAELDLVHRVQRALGHLHQLYEEVRRYAGPILLDRQPCELAPVWRSAWSHLEAQSKEKRVELREEITGQDLSCQGDEFALGQVFRNILENSIDACPDPGEIVIRCRNTKLDGRPAIAVSIRDNGVGFAPEAVQRVFEPFFTTKPKGTGLGMAIAQRIVQAHGGTITVGEPCRTGAEFIVTLPMS